MSNKKWVFTRLGEEKWKQSPYLIIKMIHMMRGKKYR